MPSPGRNEPCPCGSGRKFKHCCGGVADTTHALPTRADRDTAFTLLDRVSALPSFKEDSLAAYAMIWSAWLHDDAGRLMESPANDLFLEWLWFDHLLHTGQTVTEHTLATHAAELGPGGRRFLRACADAPLRLVQVTRVEAGSRVHVRDVVDRGDIIAVSERAGSEQLVRHDVMAARIAGYDAEAQFEGVNLLFAVRDKLAIARRIRQLRKQLTREIPAGLVRDRRLRMSTGVAIVTSAIALFDRPRPRLTTTDGDELVLADAVFGVIDAGKVRSALNRAPDLDADDPTAGRPDELERYTWFDEPRPGDGRRVLGSVVVGPALLRVETMSMARARRAQEYFAGLAGETALRFNAIQVKSVEAMLRSARADPNPPEAEIDPEVTGDIERAFYEKHYREWLDLPVPALGDRTPREAARVKRLRAKLLVLVEGIENQAARQAKEGRGFDASYLRPELGLKDI